MKTIVALMLCLCCSVSLADHPKYTQADQALANVDSSISLAEAQLALANTAIQAGLTDLALADCKLGEWEICEECNDEYEDLSAQIQAKEEQGDEYGSTANDIQSGAYPCIDIVNQWLQVLTGSLLSMDPDNPNIGECDYIIGKCASPLGPQASDLLGQAWNLRVAADIFRAECAAILAAADAGCECGGGEYCK